MGSTSSVHNSSHKPGARQKHPGSAQAVPRPRRNNNRLGVLGVSAHDRRKAVLLQNLGRRGGWSTRSRCGRRSWKNHMETHTIFSEPPHPTMEIGQMVILFLLSSVLSDCFSFALLYLRRCSCSVLYLQPSSNHRFDPRKEVMCFFPDLLGEEFEEISFDLSGIQLERVVPMCGGFRVVAVQRPITSATARADGSGRVGKCTMITLLVQGLLESLRI